MTYSIIHDMYYALGGLHLPLGWFASPAWGGLHLLLGWFASSALGGLHLPVGWFASSAWVVCIFRYVAMWPRHHAMWLCGYYRPGGRLLSFLKVFLSFGWSQTLPELLLSICNSRWCLNLHKHRKHEFVSFRKLYWASNKFQIAGHPFKIV